MTFAKQFADTKIAAQAAKLAALEWQVNSDKSDYNATLGDVKTEMTQENTDQQNQVKATLNAAIADRKSVMNIALAAAKNGAPAATVDAILNAPSAGEATLAAGSSLVNPHVTPGATQMTSDIASASSAFETGLSGKGYNGRGPDGYVDPNLYTALYNTVQSKYGSAGAAAFLKKYPPNKNINPAAVAEGILPTEVANAVTAGQLPANQAPGARPKSTLASPTIVSKIQ